MITETVMVMITIENEITMIPPYPYSSELIDRILEGLKNKQVRNERAPRTECVAAVK